ncbi:hypothetical protein [Methylobacterium iners]|uniref:hypothetical protein n=1 Tax=Methylobacterium iners TaxID=418707 RepID=UPI001EE2C398|nr:hypothetical protein [Methylobacterium iners]
MAYRRSISWSYALQGLRADREQISKIERRAALAVSAFANLAFGRAQALGRVTPLIVCGRFNRIAIMWAATIAAKARRTVTGESWSVCLSAALKGTWQAARAARRQVMLRRLHNADRLYERTGTHDLRTVNVMEGGVGILEKNVEVSPTILAKRSKPKPGTQVVAA